jgi:general secretion pathway protein N
MRVRLPLGRSLFFVCAFLFALIALFPLRLALDWLALDERGFAAREAKGSIWFGGLSEAQFGTVALGDLTAELRTLPLSSAARGWSSGARRGRSASRPARASPGTASASRT